MINELTLKDLHNPNNITGILTVKDGYIEVDTDQKFQEYPKSIELWQMYNGHLMRVKRWLSKSIIATY